jgi:hypothetical protein
VLTSPPYLRVVKYGYYNWLRTWFLGFDARAIDDLLDDAHHREPYLLFMREVLHGLRPVLADDAVVVLVIGDVELDRGRRISSGFGLAAQAWEAAAAPEGYRLAGSPPTTWRRAEDDEAGATRPVERRRRIGCSCSGRRRPGAVGRSEARRCRSIGNGRCDA